MPTSEHCGKASQAYAIAALAVLALGFSASSLGAPASLKFALLLTTPWAAVMLGILAIARGREARKLEKERTQPSDRSNEGAPAPTSAVSAAAATGIAGGCVAAFLGLLVGGLLIAALTFGTSGWGD